MRPRALHHRTKRIESELWVQYYQVYWHRRNQIQQRSKMQEHQCKFLHSYWEIESWPSCPCLNVRKSFKVKPRKILHHWSKFHAFYESAVITWLQAFCQTTHVGIVEIRETESFSWVGVHEKSGHDLTRKSCYRLGIWLSIHVCCCQAGNSHWT